MIENGASRKLEKKKEGDLLPHRWYSLNKAEEIKVHSVSASCVEGIEMSSVWGSLRCIRRSYRKWNEKVNPDFWEVYLELYLLGGEDS